MATSCVAMLFFTLIYAESSEQKEYNGEFSFGLNLEDSNYENKDTYTAGLKYKRPVRKHLLMSDASLRYEDKKASLTPKEVYKLSLLDEYSLSHFHSLYGKYSYIKDSANYIDDKHKLGIGFLQYWIKKDPFFLKTRTGVQTVRSTYIKNTNHLPTNYNNYKLGITAMNHISKTFRIESGLDYEKDFSSSYYEVDCSFEASFDITKQLAFGIKYSYAYTNIPAASNLQNTETLTTSLIKFKF